MPPKRKRQQPEVPTPGPDLSWANELDHVPVPEEITQDQAERAIGFTTAQPCKSRVVAYEQHTLIELSESGNESAEGSRKKTANGKPSKPSKPSKPVKLSKKLLESLITDEVPPCRAKFCQSNVMCLNHLGVEQVSSCLTGRLWAALTLPAVASTGRIRYILSCPRARRRSPTATEGGRVAGGSESACQIAVSSNLCSLPSVELGRHLLCQRLHSSMEQDRAVEGGRAGLRECIKSEQGERSTPHYQ